MFCRIIHLHIPSPSVRLSSLHMAINIKVEPFRTPIVNVRGIDFPVRHHITLSDPIERGFLTCASSGPRSKDPTLVLRRIFLPALSSESPRNPRIFFLHGGNTFYIHLDSIVSRMRSQLLPNPANRPRAGVQQRVMPFLHPGNRCWSGERK